MIIEFDVDNTIVSQGKPGHYNKVKPFKDAVKTINKLYRSGHIIIFHTARHWKYFEETYKQLKKFGFKFHSLVMGKINAEIIVDDRSVKSIEELKNRLGI